jgi:hypothetical protein
MSFYEHFPSPSYVVNTLTQTSTQRAHTHSESTFLLHNPCILTIPHIDTILRKSQERVDHVLTRNGEDRKIILPLTIWLPQVQDNAHSKDPFFIDPFAYQENPVVGTA